MKDLRWPTVFRVPEDQVTRVEEQVSLLRGILAARQEGIPVEQYPPATIKKAVTGSGSAHKSQVSRMVRVVLAIDEDLPEDAADALAVAICHLNRV